MCEYRVQKNLVGKWSCYLFQASFEVKFETKDDLLSFFALLSGV